MSNIETKATEPTPSVEVLAEYYCYDHSSNNWETRMAYEAKRREEFDRAIEKIRNEAKEEALKAEANNLRELYVLTEETPWNPMPAEDKARCYSFMEKSGVDIDEYAERHLKHYADWLDYRAEQIRSNDG